MPGGGGVEVQESGRALKVHTDSPHLVSLGGGRLSTAVTLHPLPEGRRTLGSGPGADLQLAGTGVDSIHCHIDNTAGVVTLHPVSGSTAIDGQQVTQSTRLLQGCMICLGRSTCLRFNHPAEARFMKSVLPNSRISMMPFPFYPGEETSMFGGVEGKPPPAPRRSGSSQDSWGDLSSASSEDLARLISPKVFPPGSSTVNSPACVVLGSRPGTPSKLSAFNKSVQSNGETKFTLPFSQFDNKVSLSNGNKQQNGSIYQNVIQLPNGRYTPSSGVESNTSVQSPASSRVTSTSSPCPSSSERGTSPSPTRPSTIRTYPPPSPVFDQQYSQLTSSDRGSSPCPNKPVPSRPLASPSPAFDRNPSYPRKSVTSPTLSWDSSVEDLTSRKDELEKKRKQAQSDRMVAQEADRMEQLRLEEILSMCADYEKQVQWEKQNKPQQNRIKTNGSLPRDKRLACSPSSPQMHKTFTFDSSDIGGHALDSPRGHDMMDKGNLDSPGVSSVDGILPSRSPHTYENITFSYPSSPRTRIKTILPSKDNSRCEYSLEVIENRLAILNDFENVFPRLAPSNVTSGCNLKSDDDNDDSIAKSARVPTSPTKENALLNSEKAPSLNSNFNDNALLTSNVNVNGNSCQEDSNHLEIENNGSKICDKLKSRAEEIAKSKYEFLGFDPRKELELPDEKMSSNLKRNLSHSASSLSVPNEESSMKNSNDVRNNDLNNIDDIKSNNDVEVKTSSLRKLKRFDTCPSWTNPVLDLGSYSSVNKNNGECTTEQLLSQLDSIVRGVQKSPISLENGKFILPLPDSPRESDSRSELVATLTKLKAKVTDVEQQQEELMRALEMEQALLHGEWEAQNEKLKVEDSKLISLREKMQHCDKEMERCADEQAIRQKQSQTVLEKHQTILNKLEQQLQSFGNDDDLKSELIESFRQQQELLDAEKKSFEDLEFSLLEEEARMLSYREELGREVSEINSRCTERRERMEQLELQREAAEQQASSSSHQLQLERLSLLRQIEEIRGKLKELDTQKRFQISPNSRSLDIYDQEGENVKKQSQDDLDRISRVTSGAPMEVSTNSLGRRAIASLQEIERNRQIHLAKQGSLVIEEERKRVSELKRRVQDEARAEWEERRQREHNCHSLNSVGSDESSLTSSDVHTESASSEDVEKRLPPPINEDKAETVSTDLSEQRDRDEREKEPPSRPVSDASSYSSDQMTVVRLRNKSNSNIQRPLTRYLPIRGESLDLRQHIESAGHQIDLCPHVIIDKTSCRGYLQKMTSRFHQWNKRWFVFDRTRHTLTYYSDRSEKKPKGGAYFKAIEEVYVDHLNSVKSPNPEVPVTFVIKSSNKTYHLVAPSPEATRIWVDVIITGAEGYQEFCLGT